MSAREFLKRLEQSQMVSEPLLAELKKRVAQAARPIRTEILAKLLVDRGELTAAQARKLVRDAEAAAAKAAEDEELDLLPLDDVPEAASWSLGGKLPARGVPADDEPLELLDERESRADEDDVEVAELDERDLPPGAGDSGVVLIDDQEENGLSELLADPMLVSAGKKLPRRGGLWQSLVAMFSGGKRAPRNQWDSPLLLFGGGALVILLFAGGILLFTLFRESGDELYGAADEAYESRSYNQAIASYDRFLDGFSGHPKAPIARVRKQLARLRQVSENSADGAPSLAMAQEVLPLIEGEGQAFGDSRPELAGLLPPIAERLTNQALATDNLPEKQEYVALAKRAMELVNNSNYLPTSVRRSQETRIEEIQENIQVAERDIHRDTELLSVVASMKQHAEQGQIADAYRNRAQLLRSYPQLRDRKELTDVVKEVTEKERTVVRSVTEPIAVSRQERQPAIPYRVSLADRRGNANPQLAGYCRAFLIQGAIYGIDLADGTLLWRRFVGDQTTVFPQLTDPTNPSSDVLLVDSRFNELVRVGGRDGKLLWRASFPIRIAAPAIVGDVVYVTAEYAEPGYLWALELSTGKMMAAVELPTGSLVGPTNVASRNELILPGLHSSLYVLDATSLYCKQVIYEGHTAGAIAVPAAAIGNEVVLGHNRGTDFSELLSLRVADETWSSSATLPRLDGHIVVPMQVEGKRILVATDRGAVKVLALDPANPATALREVAALVAKRNDALVTFPLLEAGIVWVADRSLTRLQLQSTRGELRQQWVRFNDDRFLGPLEQIKDFVVQIRRRNGMFGATVSALHADAGDRGGEPEWQVDLGVPLADAFSAVASPSNDVVAVTANGALFHVDGESIRSGTDSSVKARVDERLLLQALTYRVSSNAPPFVLASDPPAMRALIVSGDEQTSLASAGWQLNGDTPIARAAVDDGVVLVPCESGAIYALDAVRGRSVIAPFQPRQEPNTTYHWLQPGTLTPPGSNQFLAALDDGTVYAVGRSEDPQPFLKKLRQWKLGSRIVAGVATIGRRGFLVTESARNSQSLTMVDADQDALVGTLPLAGVIAWGPTVVGQQILLGDDTGQVYGVSDSGQVAWQWTHEGKMTGAPALVGGQFVFASDVGIVSVVDATGQLVGQVDVAEPLAGRPISYRGRLLIPGRDGTLYLVEKPGGNER